MSAAPMSSVTNYCLIKVFVMFSNILIYMDWMIVLNMFRYFHMLYSSTIVVMELIGKCDGVDQWEENSRFRKLPERCSHIQFLVHSTNLYILRN